MEFELLVFDEFDELEFELFLFDELEFELFVFDELEFELLLFDELEFDEPCRSAPGNIS